MLTFGSSSGASGKSKNPTSTLTAPLICKWAWEPVLGLHFFVLLFLTFLRKNCSFPCFPEAHCLIPAFALTWPCFPRYDSVSHYSLFPDVSSQVLIMGFKNAVPIMITLSKAGKWGSYQGFMKAQMVKSLPAMLEIWVWSLGREDPWRRKWPPTPVFLLGKSHGQRSLMGYRLRGRRESETTEGLTHRHEQDNWAFPVGGTQ